MSALWTVTDALRFRRVLPAADVIAFEPNPRNFDLMAADARLPRQRIRIFPFAVSDRDAEAPFFVVGARYARNRDLPRRGISSLHRRADSSSISDVVRVRTVRLDGVLTSDSSTARIALWIDTEGMGFEAIAGASRVLARTQMLHVEVETVPLIGAKQKLLPDIERLLDADFALLATDHPRDWSQLNALFVRKDALRAHAAEIRAHLANERLRPPREDRGATAVAAAAPAISLATRQCSPQVAQSVALGEEVRAGTSARILYRPDIDGLRAISVLAVILFHSAVPGFAGGYVGVDVFFVISGYLITQVLMAAPERSLGGRLREFYVRRCRRILPALLVMLVATVAVACWLFLPGDLPHFGAVLSATSVFAGNVVAWQSGGYFEMHDPSFNPLAHLWSLAVEEQFYIVFPLIFLASGKARNGRQLTLIASCVVVSFALCVWASYTHPRANFFLAPTRAWELLLGSLVALGLGRSLSTHPLRGIVSGAALLALLGCVIGYDGSLPYPGLYALVPCGSAALLLAAGAGARRSNVGRWLGTPAPRGQRRPSSSSRSSRHSSTR